MQNYIIAARTAQGYEEWNRSTREERHDVISRCHATQIELAKEKEAARQGSIQAPQWHLTLKEHHRLSMEKRKSKKNPKGKVSTESRKENTDTVAHPRQPAPTDDDSSSADFEEAIQASVEATSHGNPDEDRMIEAAIRASVAELQRASKEGDDKDAVQRAIQASVAENARSRAGETLSSHSVGARDDDDLQRQLEEALSRSMQEHHPLPKGSTKHSFEEVDFDDSGVDTDDDQNIKAAIKKSILNPEAHREHVPADEEMKEALELSKKEHEEELGRVKTEEDIVLAYMKRQSLAEEELKKKKGMGDPSGEELKRAMEESLKEGKDEG